MRWHLHLGRCVTNSNGSAGRGTRGLLLGSKCCDRKWSDKYVTVQQSNTTPLGSDLWSQSWWRKHVIGEDAKDLGEMWINFARNKLGLGENVGKLRVTWDPVKLVGTVGGQYGSGVQYGMSCGWVCHSWWIWKVASLSIIKIAGVVGKHWVDSCHWWVPR